MECDFSNNRHEHLTKTVRSEVPDSYSEGYLVYVGNSIDQIIKIDCRRGRNSTIEGGYTTYIVYDDFSNNRHEHPTKTVRSEVPDSYSEGYLVYV